MWSGIMNESMRVSAFDRFRDRGRAADEVRALGRWVGGCLGGGEEHERWGFGEWTARRGNHCAVPWLEHGVRRKRGLARSHFLSCESGGEATG